MLRLVCLLTLCVPLWAQFEVKTVLPTVHQSVSSPCDLPRVAQYVASTTLYPTKQSCEYNMGCWDDSRAGPAVCILPKIDGSDSCDDVDIADRVGCPAVNQLQCMAQGCCWRPGAAEKCYQKRVESECDIPLSDRVACSSSYEISCGLHGCCRSETGTCYRHQACDPRFYYITRCLKECGVGIRLIFNGCWRLIGIIFCCEEPCPGGGGTGGGGRACRDYEPYKSTRGAPDGK